jgi:hypothetical protein
LVVDLSVNVLDYTVIVNGYQEGEGDGVGWVGILGKEELDPS